MDETKEFTTYQPFGVTDDLPLFAVVAGIAREDALEQASSLIGCVEAIAAARGIPDRDMEANAIQYLAEASKAIVRACNA